MEPSGGTEYLVLLPTCLDGIDYGYVAPLRIKGTTYEDALRKAVDEWWSGQIQEGVATVIPIEGALAFVLGEVRGFEIVQEVPVPDVRSESK